MLYDKIGDTIVKSYEVMMNIIRESVHQWIDNIVTPSWWNHLWINRGLAEYFKFHIVDMVVYNGIHWTYFYLLPNVKKNF